MPYGLGAGSIDAALNYYVASNYSPRVMNFLHCFYGVGAVISPNIMAFALLKANWHAGYLWTAILQGFIYSFASFLCHYGKLTRKLM
jgi:fucose permease